MSIENRKAYIERARLAASMWEALLFNSKNASFSRAERAAAMEELVQVDAWLTNVRSSCVYGVGGLKLQMPVCVVVAVQAFMRDKARLDEEANFDEWKQSRLHVLGGGGGSSTGAGMGGVSAASFSELERVSALEFDACKACVVRAHALGIDAAKSAPAGFDVDSFFAECE